MRFLADENFPGAVAALRRAGLAEDWALELAPGASDEAVLARALDSGSVILTFDKIAVSAIFFAERTLSPSVFAGTPSQRPRFPRTQWEATMPGTDALKALHTSLIDAEKGYQTAIEDAKDPQMKAIFASLEALHAGAHADVHDILTANGELPDESGSFMSLVHKTVISVRSAVTGLEPSSLKSFADGEERIVELYDKAIVESAGSGNAPETLRRHRQALVAAIAEMRAKAA